MSLTEETYHLINSYFSGDLRGRELDKFKAKMRDDKDFQLLVEQQKAIIEAIEQSRDQELKQVISEGLKSGVVPMFSKKLKVAIATAATIALLAAVFIMVPRQLKKDTPLVKDTTEAKSIERSANNSQVQEEKEEPVTLVDSQTLAVAEVEISEEQIAIEGTESDEGIDTTISLNDKLDESLAPQDSLTVATSESVQNKPAKSLENKTEYEDAEEMLDEDNILTDKLIASKSYVVYAASPDFDSEDEAYDNIQTDSRSYNKEDKTSKKVKVQSREIKVEFWNSVVNFKGYQYDGNTLKLYSIQSDKIQGFKELDKRLYVKLDGSFYYIEQGIKHKRLAQVTSPTLLKVLEE